MAKWSWRTTPDESVEIDRGDGEGMVRSTSLPHPNVIATQRRVLEWGPLAAQAGAKHGVPLSWILAFVFAESGGKADADNAPQCSGTGCVGLMAIHWKVHGQTREDMLDPAKNLDYGTSLLAESRRRGYDLPAAASIHVAGGGTEYKPHSGTCCSAMCKPSCDRKCSEHPDFPGGSPFGMCEHMHTMTDGDGSVGYIDRIVRANNSFIDLLAGKGYADPIDDPFYEPDLPDVTPTAPPSGGMAALALFLGSGVASYLATGEVSRRYKRRS